MEGKGLGEIKVKGMEWKVMKAWKWNLVKMVYNTLILTTLTHLSLWVFKPLLNTTLNLYHMIHCDMPTWGATDGIIQQ